MNVLIITSSSDAIGAEYLDIALSVSDVLAKQEFDLVYGGSSLSMMGACYNVFSKYNRKIYAYTTPKYQDQFALLPNAKHYLEETTFDLKKDLFKNADIVVCLPGGLGTYSEVLAFLEEKKSNDKVIPIILYNDYGFFNKLLDVFKELKDKKFTDKNISDYFIAVNNIEEFEKVISELRRIMK